MGNQFLTPPGVKEEKRPKEESTLIRSTKQRIKEGKKKNTKEKNYLPVVGQQCQ